MCNCGYPMASVTRFETVARSNGVMTVDIYTDCICCGPQVNRAFGIPECALESISMPSGALCLIQPNLSRPADTPPCREILLDDYDQETASDYDDLDEWDDE